MGLAEYLSCLPHKVVKIKQDNVWEAVDKNRTCLLQCNRLLFRKHDWFYLLSITECGEGSLWCHNTALADQCPAFITAQHYHKVLGDFKRTSIITEENSQGPKLKRS